MSNETNKQYNLDIYDPFETIGFYDMPVIRKTEHTPKSLLGFNYAKSSKKYESGIHFFLDDYQFERLWRSPQTYINMLSEFDCVLTPDFSLYTDMPKAMMIWNTYRSRLLGNFWQQEGLTVVPTVSWADEDSFDFCFDGLPLNSILAISTVGVKQTEKATQIWIKGFEEMIENCHPKKLIVYGPKLDYDMTGGIDIIYFPNEQTERLHKLEVKSNGRKRVKNNREIK